ncbi:MAG: glutathione S-transferase family protein [Spirochaetales bacterium]|nr:glutathione S-transferase family protein [Leptospiraceae bacterium]MCP5480502.1 glutathione S-transferase family protein [Spirochaetales bacterium]
MQWKLYYHENSTFARRVRIAAEEKQIQLEAIRVRMERREHKREDFLKLNPYGRVPVLVTEDGRSIYESIPILFLLEDLFPEHPLMSRDPLERALMHNRLQICDLEFAIPCTKIYFQKRFFPEERWDREAFAEAEKRIAPHLQLLGAELQEHEYLVGDAFSLAEVAYLPFLAFRDLLQCEIPPSVERWAERLLKRPSALATQPTR